MRYPSSSHPTSVYVLRDPATGRYIDTTGERPRLAPFAEASRRPATREGLTEIVQLAADTLVPLSIPFELDRVDPPRLV